MRTTSYRNFSVLILFVILSAVIFASPLKAVNVITSFDFQISPAAQTAKIGDYLLFRMAVVDATEQYSDVVEVTADANNVVVSSPTFPSGWPGAMYVYDGTHTWLVTVAGYSPAPQQLTLNNSNMIAGQPIASYYTMQYADFKAAEGSLSTGGNGTVDVGPASGIVLSDDGSVANHNDATAGDGIYNGKFAVTENYQFNIQNGAVTGKFVKGGIQASNAPYTASDKIQIDGIRPKISLVNANPNPFNPNKELEQFYYSLSENSTVTLAIYQGATLIKNLTATGIYGINQPILWDGLDNNGALVLVNADYNYVFGVTDMVGNTGVSFTGVLKLTTVTLTTSLYSIDTQYIHTSQSEVEVTIQMHAELTNASAANMRNLGFDYPDSHDYRNYPWLYIDLRMYDSLGNLTTSVVKDNASAIDYDSMYINLADAAYNPTFFDGSPLVGDIIYDPKPTDGCTIIPLHVYKDSDEILTNDWDNVFFTPFKDNGGGSFSSDPSYRYFSETMSPGTYIVAFRGVLVGKSIVQTNAKTLEGAADCVVGTTTASVKFLYDTYHAMPSYFYDSTVDYVVDSRGYGLASDDNTVSFIVEQNPSVPATDTTPPYIVTLSASPSDGKVLQPGDISPTNYIKVDIKDDGVGAGSVNLTTIVLLDPSGNPVPGHVAWNGGTAGTKQWSVYYIPDAPITTGGSYQYTVTPEDGIYNIGTPVTYKFSVYDTSIPVVSNVSVQPNSGNPVDLSKTISTEIDFFVSKIEAAINSGGTAEVDWAATSIKVSGVAGTTDHVTGTNLLTFTPYSIMADGSYTVSITTVSVNGYKGVVTYKFYVTTSTTTTTYVNLNGIGDNSSTYLVIASYTSVTSGVTDANSVSVAMSDMGRISVATVASPPAAPSGYAILGSAVAFNIASTPAPAYKMGLTFDPILCTSHLRMHYSDADAATLTLNGLTTAELSLWVYESSWAQVTTTNKIVNNGTDHYLELSVADIPYGNRYALMYQPPAVAPSPRKFDNDKAFNPTKAPAKIYYSDTISDITGIKVYIYNLSGTTVRSLDFTDSVEHSLFTSYDSDPVSASTLKYYMIWDGKNDKGSFVRNGLYILKYRITRTTGAAVTNSRIIAVVK